MRRFTLFFFALGIIAAGCNGAPMAPEPTKRASYDDLEILLPRCGTDGTGYECENECISWLPVLYMLCNPGKRVLCRIELGKCAMVKVFDGECTCLQHLGAVLGPVD